MNPILNDGQAGPIRAATQGVVIPPPVNIVDDINASFSRIIQPIKPPNIEQNINGSFANLASVPNIEQNISRSIQENINRQLAGAPDMATGEWSRLPGTYDYEDILEAVGPSKKVKLMALFSNSITVGNASRAPTVVFDITPELSETQGVSYITIGEIFQAAEIAIFSGSQSRTFNLNAKFVSRTVIEARNNLRRINRLKSWTKPDKQERTMISGGTQGFPSGTPAVLSLFGYGERLNGITVVIENLTINYPEDVDYITIGSGQQYGNMTSIPIICPVTISLKEVHSPEDIRQFDIVKYRQGELPGW